MNTIATVPMMQMGAMTAIIAAITDKVDVPSASNAHGPDGHRRAAHASG
jgi:hypothetical protein